MSWYAIKCHDTKSKRRKCPGSKLLNALIRCIRLNTFIYMYSTICCYVRTEYDEMSLSEFPHAGVVRAGITHDSLNECDVEA